MHISPRNTSAGFSLVELLVVIAVIGLIAAIAIPNVSSITNSAQTVKDQHNAQTVASVATDAIAAGFHSWPAAASSSALPPTDQVISALEQGVNITNGGKVLTFSVGPFSEQEAEGIKKYFSFDGTNITYDPAGLIVSGT